MLAHQIQAQGNRFEKAGGFREQLTVARTAERARQEDAPLCPDCGRPMHKRKAKTGQNAGQEFWGCTGYPECKGVRNV